MNRIRLFLCFFIVVIAMLLPQIAAAQQIYPASGALDDAGEGLWNYYKGKSRNTVKRNAPIYDRINDSSSYLLDYKKIRGVELFLTAEFTGNKLSQLQLMTAFPEHSTCNKEIRDTSKSFAEVGYALMGVNFDKKECTTVGGTNGSMVCVQDDTACVYRLCPDETWALACTLVEK